MPIITIDGNIGCGKTSVLNYLHKTHKLAIDLEPVENWNSHLIKQYDDKLDVFKFQIRIWLDRCWIQEKSDKSVILMERSPLFIKNTFIRTAKDLDMITEKEYEILMDLYRKTDSLWCTSKYIYLRSSPENCYKRIKKRNRLSEKNITQDYIQILHDYHEALSLEKDLNIVVINVDDKSIADIAIEIMQHVS
jgi:deoxyadenosine/deoxycytidine kinase